MKWKLLLLTVIALVSCSTAEKPESTQRSMYYWRTVFELDSTEQVFLNRHSVSRLYVRYFDVVLDEAGEPIPNATIAFRTARPKGVEIVPTVFILNDCMAHRHDGLAENILQRVRQMSETHDMGAVKELQVDCDWTQRTRREYFSFLEEFRQLTNKEGIKLSVTIRLHQLSQPVPPADRGVLMVYNTGDVADLQCENPIIDVADVKPYMRHLKRYELPMSAAYPLFTWKVLFRRGRFVGIMHTDDELPVLSTDSIVTRQADLTHITEARKMIGTLRPELHDEVILYDLQRKNITRFNTDDYEALFSR